MKNFITFLSIFFCLVLSAVEVKMKMPFADNKYMDFHVNVERSKDKEKPGINLTLTKYFNDPLDPHPVFLNLEETYSLLYRLGSVVKNEKATTAVIKEGKVNVGKGVFENYKYTSEDGKLVCDKPRKDQISLSLIRGENSKHKCGFLFTFADNTGQNISFSYMKKFVKALQKETVVYRGKFKAFEKGESEKLANTIFTRRNLPVMKLVDVSIAKFAKHIQQRTKKSDVIGHKGFVIKYPKSLAKVKVSYSSVEGADGESMEWIMKALCRDHNLTFERKGHTILLKPAS